MKAPYTIYTFEDRKVLALGVATDLPKAHEISGNVARRAKVLVLVTWHGECQPCRCHACNPTVVAA